MRLRFVGDSYDIVKQSILRWLGSLGPWATHPMFTEVVTSKHKTSFSRLLGTRLLSGELLTTATDRDRYLRAARACKGHVFLDPDTGIRVVRKGGKSAPAYLFGDELLAIAAARPNSLTLVFDQSVARGRERAQLDGKLSALAEKGLHGVAYVSHACFVLVGQDGPLVAKALRTLKRGLSRPLLKSVAAAAD